MLKDHTLLIPTHNRPGLLADNLAFLAGQNLGSKVLILDSSKPDAQAANVRSARQSGLRCEHRSYAPEVVTYLKFVDGIRRVETPFASFCPDDDLVFVDCLTACVRRLQTSPDVAICHGYYFIFDVNQMDGAIDLTWLIYAAPSIVQEDPLVRLAAALRTYQALCYGVFRTPTLLQSYDMASRADSMLFSELVSSLTSIVHGKAIRLPEIYMGRRAAQPGEAARRRWHPLGMVHARPRRPLHGLPGLSGSASGDVP